MAKFQVRPTVGAVVETFRMGSTGSPLTDKDKGKAVKLAADSQVALAGEDDEIFGFMTSIESGTQDGFKIGGVQVNDYAYVDTDTATVGQVVVVAANQTLGTAHLTKVKKASNEEDVIHKWIVVHPGVIRKV